jgi:glycerophosphoryl diester phosphodiesterase
MTIRHSISNHFWQIRMHKSLAAFTIPIAHRGLHDRQAGIIENTVRAITRSIDKGYGVEIDLRPSRDHVAMVFHDLKLDRLIAAGGQITDYSASELQKLPFHDDADPMLTLAGLLALVDGKAPLLIEIKSDWHGFDEVFLQNIARELKSYKGPVALMSFDPAIVGQLTALLPQHARGLLSGPYTGGGWWSDRLGLARRLALRNLLSAPIVRPHFIAYDVRGLPALAPYLARHVFRLPLFTWTVRTPSERACAERWADATIFEGYLPVTSAVSRDHDC